MSRAVDALWSALAMALWAGIMAMGMYAFIMPEPGAEERGREQYARMMQQLEAEQAQCEASQLRRVRAVREPSAEELADARATCDRTSAWR